MVTILINGRYALSWILFQCILRYHIYIQSFSGIASLQTLSKGSKSFYFASLFFDAITQRDVAVFYSLCRHADDIVDVDDNIPTHLQRSPQRRAAQVAILWERILECYAPGEASKGEPLRQAFLRLAEGMEGDALVALGKVSFVALERVIQQYDITLQPLQLLFTGFLWDLSVDIGVVDGDEPRKSPFVHFTPSQHTRNQVELEAYSLCVAGSVGLFMAFIMGKNDSKVAKCAIELGIAMQLTNIARDVGEDARRGRIYLPQTEVTKEGVDALLRGECKDEVRECVRRLLSRADELYQSASIGIAHLPIRFWPAITCARFVYRDIGIAIEKLDYNSVHSRAFTRPQDKLWAIGKAVRFAVLQAPFLRWKSIDSGDSAVTPAHLSVLWDTIEIH